MVVAVGRNGEIGADNNLLWPIKEDLRHFRTLTMGHPVIMGRRTWESLPRRPLPGRPNYVVSRNASYECPGAVLCGSLQEALSRCEAEGAKEEPASPLRQPMIIGGASLYNEAMPLAERLYVTDVDAEAPHADVFFPAIDKEEWRETERSASAETPDGIRYAFLTLERRHRHG